MAHGRFLLDSMGRIDPPDWATILPSTNISEGQHFSIVIVSGAVAFSATRSRARRAIALSYRAATVTGFAR